MRDEGKQTDKVYVYLNAVFFSLRVLCDKSIFFLGLEILYYKNANLIPVETYVSGNNISGKN